MSNGPCCKSKSEREKKIRDRKSLSVLTARFEHDLLTNGFMTPAKAGQLTFCNTFTGKI